MGWQMTIAFTGGLLYLLGALDEMFTASSDVVGDFSRWAKIIGIVLMLVVVLSLIGKELTC